ncbi:(2Fe-2S)-binding protein [Pseudophaeobacter sp. 1A16562]|uniref:(2Fe-2S)-binding protein n=1 Tax=Pseudophaeobacter sp. 1A16562 TaxID=3098143 RepID=UPI0034D3FCA5
MQFTLNGRPQDIPDAWKDEPLLYLLREHFNLKGAKFGCGVGFCGACTVIADGVAMRSCITSARDVEGLEVRTIEGLAEGETLHPVQQAWLDLSVPQCGYCQAGQIMSAVALLEEVPNPSEQDIETGMDGNLCRCGTYPRIRAAIARAAEATQ